MHTAVRRRTAAPIALAAALLAAFLVLIAPLPAAAHDSLVASSPEADSTVDTLPAELTLTFSAKLIDGEGATEVVVTDAAGTAVTDGAPILDGAVVTQPLTAEAAAGEYRVIWKVVSSDGHPTSGEFSFTVATSTMSASTAPTASPTTAAPAEQPAETAEPTSAPAAADEERTAAPMWIWVLAIVGILVVLVIVIWLVSRGRRSGAGARSEDSSAR